MPTKTPSDLVNNGSGESAGSFPIHMLPMTLRDVLPNTITMGNNLQPATIDPVLII